MGVSVIKRSVAVFLDRDGVINCNVMNPLTRAWEAPMTAEDLVLSPNTGSALRALREAGFLLFLVSNQPNHAKGKASLQTLDRIHNRLLAQLNNEKVMFDAFYYCLHHPHGVVREYSGLCLCRKPSPFFLFQARDKFCLDLEHSWMIGDRNTDIQCGQTAGVRTIRVLNNEEDSCAADGDMHAEFQVDGLKAAVAIILHAANRCVRRALKESD
ncbi:MAG TPA: HAD-IIIA family hydrolase [Acidobacteriaceae bacterium]